MDLRKRLAGKGRSHMSSGCVISDCIWAEGSFCDTLEQAGVPLDGKWPLTILYLRGIRDIAFLSETQKGAMQELLMQILRERDFSERRYNQAQEGILSIITSPYNDKLREFVRETSELAKNMHSMFGRHSQEVSDIVKRVDDDLARGVEPASLLTNLRETLKNVVAIMEQDATTMNSLLHKDSLTGLANRRSFDIFLEESLQLWLTGKKPLSLIIFDLDHFKKFNDTYGHLVGDQVLRTVAKIIMNIAEALSLDKKSEILAARYGGEEFCLVLRGPAAAKAGAIADNIRQSIGQTVLLLRDTENNVVQSGLHITVSVGFSTMWSGWSGAYLANLIDSADKALYHAKRNGRDCTVEYTPEGKKNYSVISKKNAEKRQCEP